MIGYLLAQTASDPTWKALRASMRKEDVPSGYTVHSLLLIAVGFLALTVGVWIINRMVERKEKPLTVQAWQLFTRAGKALGLGVGERLILTWAARSSKLKNPTVMLFTPELLARHAGAWADRFPLWSLRPFLRTQLSHISEQVFNQPLPDRFALSGPRPEPQVSDTRLDGPQK